MAGAKMIIDVPYTTAYTISPKHIKSVKGVVQKQGKQQKPKRVGGAGAGMGK